VWFEGKFIIFIDENGHEQDEGHVIHPAFRHLQFVDSSFQNVLQLF